MLESIIAYLYLISGSIALAGYIPQLRVLWRAEQSPNEISVKTWTIWFAEGIIALLFGIICLQDMIFCFIVAVDILFMGTIITMVIYNRYVLFGNSRNFIDAFFTYYFCRPFFAMPSQPIGAGYRVPRPKPRPRPPLG